MISGLDALATGIMRYEGFDPKTRSFKNMNVGNLRLTGQPADDKGYTIFPDFISGYNALLRELASKLSGHNTHGIGPSSTLLSLFKVYAPSADNNVPEEYADFIAKWLTLALGKPITIESELVNVWEAPSPAPPPAQTTLDASDL